jgi:hypothetical protein
VLAEGRPRDAAGRPDSVAAGNLSHRRPAGGARSGKARLRGPGPPARNPGPSLDFTAGGHLETPDLSPPGRDPPTARGPSDAVTPREARAGGRQARRSGAAAGDGQAVGQAGPLLTAAAARGSPRRRNRGRGREVQIPAPADSSALYQPPTPPPSPPRALWPRLRARSHFRHRRRPERKCLSRDARR